MTFCLFKPTPPPAPTKNPHPLGKCPGCLVGIFFNRHSQQAKYLCSWCLEQFKAYVSRSTDEAVDAAWEKFKP